MLKNRVCSLLNKQRLKRCYLSLDFDNYFLVNIRLGWNPALDVSTSLSITKLFDDLHAESVDTTRVNTATGRGVFLSASIDFH